MANEPIVGLVEEPAKEEINQGREKPAETAARRAAWLARPAPPPEPLNAEEIYDMLKAKGVLSAIDRPRGRAA